MCFDWWGRPGYIFCANFVDIGVDPEPQRRFSGRIVLIRGDHSGKFFCQDLLDCWSTFGQIFLDELFDFWGSLGYIFAELF